MSYVIDIIKDYAICENGDIIQISTRKRYRLDVVSLQFTVYGYFLTDRNGFRYTFPISSLIEQKIQLHSNITHLPIITFPTCTVYRIGFYKNHLYLIEDGYITECDLFESDIVGIERDFILCSNGEVSSMCYSYRYERKNITKLRNQGNKKFKIFKDGITCGTLFCPIRNGAKLDTQRDVRQDTQNDTHDVEITNIAHFAESHDGCAIHKYIILLDNSKLYVSMYKTLNSGDMTHIQTKVIYENVLSIVDLNNGNVGVITSDRQFYTMRYNLQLLPGCQYDSVIGSLNVSMTGVHEIFGEYFGILYVTDKHGNIFKAVRGEHNLISTGFIKDKKFKIKLLFPDVMFDFL